MKKHLQEWQNIWERKAEKDTGLPPAVVSGFDDLKGGFTPQRQQIMIDEIATNLGLLPYHSLLEVGCGAGMLLDYFSNKCRRVVGVDFALAMVKEAAKNVPVGQFFKAEAADLSALPHQSFDRVLVNSVFQYFPDYEHARSVLRELLRVCKIGGRVVIYDIPNIEKKEACEKIRKQAGKKSGPGHLYFDKNFFRQYLSADSYTIIDQSGHTTINSKFRFNVIIDKTVQ